MLYLHNYDVISKTTINNRFKRHDYISIGHRKSESPILNTMIGSKCKLKCQRTKFMYIHINQIMSCFVISFFNTVIFNYLCILLNQQKVSVFLKCVLLFSDKGLIWRKENQSVCIVAYHSKNLYNSKMLQDGKIKRNCCYLGRKSWT